MLLLLLLTLLTQMALTPTHPCDTLHLFSPAVFACLGVNPQKGDKE